MQHFLYPLNGERENQAVPVQSELIVGRHETCDLSLSDRRLSRRHARFYIEEGQLFVEDLKSPNGTIVNGQRVNKTDLKNGDTIILGRTHFRVTSDPSGASPPARYQVRGPVITSDHRPQVIRPAKSALGPGLDNMLAKDYFSALGLGDETMLDASANRFESVLRQTRNFAILHEVSRAMQREHDPQQMLERVLEVILKVTKARLAYVALLDEDETLQVEVVRQSKGQGGQVTFSQTVAEQVLGKRCGVICADPTADARFQSSESLFLNDTRSLMAVPILVGNRVLGLIGVESSHLTEKFSENDLDLLSVVSSTVGVGLDNLKLAKKREQTILELEQAQAQLIAAQDRLVKSEQLAAIGRLATGIAHEVKNHLSPFMLADMIARKYPQDQEIQMAAEIMLEAQQHILDLVNEVRAFVSGDSSEYRMEPTDLCEVVDRVLRFMQCDKVVKKANVTLAKDSHPIVDLDAQAFRQVLINLIRNAADAVPEGKPGIIKIRIWEADQRAFVDVVDNGRGIPEELKPKIFEPFFSTKGKAGLGLGLDISRKIIVDHGGQLDFQSEPEAGTTFRIALPAREVTEV